MTDESSLDDLSIEELEEILEARRRARALARFRRVADGDQAPSDDVRIPPPRRRAERTELKAETTDARWPRSVTGPSRGPSERNESGDAGGAHLSLKPVEIVAEGGAVDRLAGSLARLNRRIWLKGFPRLRDRLLLLLELAALAGLIFVVYSSLSELHLLNKEVAEALESDREATPVATAASVLPGGSRPPATEGIVPGPYRHLVGSGASIPIPTPGPRQASRIVIPAIEVDAPVVEGDGWEELKMGAGHRVGSANPGERGNVVISGHNDVYGEIFRHLEDLTTGDEVIVYAGDTPHRYLVVAKMVVGPGEVSLLEPTPNA
ncbi:MAG TPA: sortase, partial [Chloroflexi bacterium]|nr:sortase [Chloroflexota bacterium]